MTTQNNNREPASGYVPEIVNLSLAVLSWILPDISITTKIIISSILIGILIISKTNLFRLSINYYQYLAIIFSSLIIGCLEFIFCGVAVYFLSQIEVKSIYQFMQYGFVYSVLVGIPVQLISISRDDDNSGMEYSAGTGCIMSVILFFIIYFSIATSISVNFYEGTYTLNLFAILAGPGVILSWWILNSLNWFSTITAGFAMLIFPYLQNLQFGAIARYIKREVR
jgi:hypothetical protein